jgi:hypothetical protein
MIQANALNALLAKTCINTRAQIRIKLAFVAGQTVIVARRTNA